MNTSSSDFKPVVASDRINSLDIIRGFAVLGILLMNITGFGLPWAYADPTISGGSEGLNLKVWIMNGLFFEGTMRGLFTLLYGAGVILLTDRLQKREAGIETADIYYRRVLWLLLFGLFHAYILLWDGEILYHYALFGLMLFPFRNTKPKTLVILAVVLMGVGTLLEVSEYQEKKEMVEKGMAVELLEKKGDSLSKDQKGELEAYQNFKKKPPQEKLEEITEGLRGSYVDAFWTKVPETKWMQTSFIYRYGAWDLLAMMFIGMAFFKWGILQNEKSTGFYLAFALVGYGLGLLVNFYEVQAEVSSNWDRLVLTEMAQTYNVGRFFVTMGHIGLVMLFIRWRVLGFLNSAFAAVGRMALTNYVMHSIFAAFIFYGFGFGLFGKLQRFELYYVVAGIWAFQLIFSPIWLRYFHFGPAEWLWRSLTYKKKQPFKR